MSLTWNATTWSQPRLGTRHPVVLDEIFASKRQELAVGWMVDYLPTDDLLGDDHSMLVDIVPKVSLSGVGADHQDIGDAGQRVANVGEEFVFGSNLAAVLASDVFMRLDALDLHVLGVELQHLGFVVIDEDHGTGN